MSLGTNSAFYHSVVVNSENLYLNFDEGGGELTAQLTAGTYSLTDLGIAIKTAMDGAVGAALTYIVGFDRSSRKFTISSTAAFSLLLLTGSQNGNSIFDEAGFTGVLDLTGLTTYTGQEGAGEEYVTQFPLQDYLDKDHGVEKISPTVNESASGIIQVTAFGSRQFFEMSFKFITNIEMDGKIIRNNPSGVEDFTSFMDNIIEKGDFEFMPDASNRTDYHKVLLESLSGNSTGTGYRLKELTNKKLPEIFELNKVKLRFI